MCLVLAGLVPTTTRAEEPKAIRLFILSGQSNMSFDETQDFAVHVEKALPGERVVVVKHAVGGQPIWHWLKGWKPPTNAKPVPGVPDTLGETYDALLAKVAKSGVDPKAAASVTLVWMQGEAEGRNPVTCEVYEASLKGLIRQFRDELKRPDMHVVIGRLNDAQMQRESWKVVRKAQESVATGDKYATWINTDDLNGDDNNVHNNAEGKKELGVRFANAAVGLIRRKPDDLAAMQGRWALMSWQDDGYDATFGGKGPAEISITDSLFRYQVFGGGRMHDDERITLDPTKEPKRFSLLREKQVHPLFKDADGTSLLYRGAYRLDGDELRITLNLKSGMAISLALDNSRARPGTKRGDKVDGFEEETDKLYVLMREEGFTAGDKAKATGLTVGTVGQSKRPQWTAGADAGELASPAKWQRLRFWFTATEPGAISVDLGDGKRLELGAVTPDKVKGATQSRADLFRYPTATLGDLTAHGNDVPYRAKVGEGLDRRGAEPFWFSVDLRRKGGELRVWVTGQTVMTTKVGSAPSPVKITAKPGTVLREVRWLEMETAK